MLSYYISIILTHEGGTQRLSPSGDMVETMEATSNSRQSFRTRQEGKAGLVWAVMSRNPSIHLEVR